MNSVLRAKRRFLLTDFDRTRLHAVLLPALVLVSVLVASAGCGPKMVVNERMALVADKQIAELEPDKARLVFIRPEAAGYNVASSVFDISSGDPEFIGIASEADAFIRARMSRYVPKWETKADKPTLHVEDGI